MIRTTLMLFAGFVALALSATALAAPTLVVVETPGDCYTITAQDSADPGVQFWRIKVDIASGAIYSFEDLTDAGDGTGGHTDYLGAGGRYCQELWMTDSLSRGYFLDAVDESHAANHFG